MKKGNQVKWIEEFAEWAATLRWDDVPERVKKLTRLQVLNMLKAACGGLTAGEHSPLRQLKSWSDGPSTAVGLGRCDPETAVFLNSFLSIAHDFDDYLFMGHTGHSSVWVPISIGEMQGETLEKVLLATIVANEIGGRLGAAVVVGPHNGQMWAHIHQVAGACATLKMMDAPPEAYFNAVLLSLYMPHFTLEAGFMASDSKKFTAALPASGGIKIGALALNGMRGANVLAGKRGFFETFSFLPLEKFLHRFGEEWVSHTLSFKPYPGCAYLQAPLECLSLIIKEWGKTGSTHGVEDVKEINVEGSILTAGMEKMSERTRNMAVSHAVNLNFSVRLSTALMLLEGEGLAPHHLNRKNISEKWERVRKIAEKVTLRHNWDFTFKAMEGLARGSDLPKAIREKGLFKVALSVRKLRKKHELFSPLKEFLSFLKSGRFRRALKMWGNMQGKSKAYGFSDLEFNFGAKVTLKTRSGAIYEAVRVRHSGAAGEPEAEIAETVQRKFLRVCSKATSQEVAESVLNAVMGDGQVKVNELMEHFRQI